MAAGSSLPGSRALTQRADMNTVPPPVMLWVLGIVLMDVFTVTVRRLARRRSPMAPDRDTSITCR